MHLAKFLLFVFLSLFTTSFYAQSDCKEAIVVCGNSSFKGLITNGYGEIEEYTRGCGSTEYNSIWLKLSIKKGGTLGFIIKPESSDINEDFDFHIFGPNANCNSLGEPIRCSTTNPLAANLSSNHTGMTNSHFEKFEGPGSDGVGYVEWLKVKDAESYFLVITRPIGSSNFSITWTGSATFDDPPTINLPESNTLDFIKSDFIGLPELSLNFDLTTNNAVINGSQTGLKITYHTSANDAVMNTNPIIDPASFKNTTNPQTIYVRTTNTVSKCFNYTSFNLKINDKFTLLKNNFEVCDDSDTNPTDGKTKIDLNKITAVIFDNEDTSNLTINYYSSQNDADNDINKLPNVFYNTTAFEQPIFIRATSNHYGAIVTKEIKLIINPLPPVNTISLIQCDYDEKVDGLVLFNLKEANSVLTNNNQDLETAFFINNSDAINNMNALPTEYINISNPQTLFVRITNLKTKCYSFSNLTLKSNVVSDVIYSIDPVCDDDGNEDGIHLFNLSDTNIPITNTQEIKYYLTENDALLEKNQIETPASYHNQTPYNQFIFARTEEENNCYGISKIKLEVKKLPNIETNATSNVCDNDPSYFAHLNSGILDNVEQIDDYSFIWKKDNIEIMNKISSTLDVNTAGIYTVTIKNKFNCLKTRTIDVTSSNNATIESIDITDLQIDDSNKITINVSGKGEYEYSLNAPNGGFQDSNIFNNIPSGIHDLYINDKNGCGVIKKTIAVLGIPKFFTPNNDGYNDYWKIKATNETFNTGAEIYIYDRYGKLIKKVLTNSNGWDGTYLGAQMPSDDYWYTIKLEDGREAKGHFTLKR